MPTFTAPRRIGRPVMALALVLVMPATAIAQPVYLAPDGVDTNPGTRDAPIASFQRAAQLGNDIHLQRGGTWARDDFRHALPHSASNVTIQPYGDGPPPMIQGGIGVRHNIQDVHIQGLHFVGNGGFGLAMRRARTSNVTLRDNIFQGFTHHITMEGSGGSNITIDGNRFLDTGTNGIFGAGGWTDVRIHNNTFDGGWDLEDGPSLQGHPIYLQSSANDAIVRDNLVVRANHIGIRALGGGDVVGNVVLLSPIGIEVGVQRGTAASPEPITADVRHNIVMHAAQGTGRGTGYTLGDAGHITFHDNLAAFLERRVLDIEDVRWDSQRIEIGDISLHEAPGPSDQARDHDAAHWVGAIRQNHPDPATILDYDQQHGGEGSWESFLQRLRQGEPGYDAKSIRQWIEQHYDITPLLLGDMNRDGAVNTADVAPFVLALTDPAAYEAQFGTSARLLGNLSESGHMGRADVGPFVHLLVSPRDVVAVPEPGSLAILALTGILLMRRSRQRS